MFVNVAVAEQYKECMNNVMLRRLCVTIVGVEK